MPNTLISYLLSLPGALPHAPSHEPGGSDEISGLGTGGHGHITILPHHYSSITQGSWDLNMNSAQFLNGYIENSTSNNGDRLNFSLFLASGTYTISFLVNTYSDSAIMDVLFDGSSQGTLDLYSAASIKNVRLSLTGIIVANSGLIQFSLLANGKNASSSAYRIRVSSISLYRTS